MSANLNTWSASISEDAEDLDDVISPQPPAPQRNYAASKFRQAGSQVGKTSSVTASFKIRQIHKEVKAAKVNTTLALQSPACLPALCTAVKRGQQT